MDAACLKETIFFLNHSQSLRPPQFHHWVEDIIGEILNSRRWNGGGEIARRRDGGGERVAARRVGSKCQWLGVYSIYYLEVSSRCIASRGTAYERRVWTVKHRHLQLIRCTYKVRFLFRSYCSSHTKYRCSRLQTTGVVVLKSGLQSTAAVNCVNETVPIECNAQIGRHSIN